MNIEDRLFLFHMRQLKREIKIKEAIIKTIKEIMSLHDDGLLTDIEYLIVCERIGW